MNNKSCNKCKKIKSLDNYYKDSSVKSGYRGICKECYSEYPRYNSKTQIPKSKKCSICGLKKNIKEYYKTRNNLYPYCKKCHSNKKKKLTKVRINEKIKEKVGTSDLTKKDILNIINENTSINKKYYEIKKKNKKLLKRINLLEDKLNEIDDKHKNYRNKINLRIKERNSSDLKFNIKSRMKVRYRNTVPYNYRYSNGYDLLDCDFEFFKKWIESQFVEGMNWDNYKVWEFDHVKPCDSFDMTNYEEQIKCFSWKNVRPSFELDNIIKSNKIIPKLVELQKKKAKKFKKAYF